MRIRIRVDFCDRTEQTIIHVHHCFYGKNKSCIFRSNRFKENVTVGFSALILVVTDAYSAHYIGYVQYVPVAFSS